MKIAYLYYDFLNLYGESGNIKIIQNILKENKIKYEIIYKSLDDKLDFEIYDFVYIGSGTEENQLIALEHLMTYKDDIKNYVENDKFILATGNSVDFFGKYIYQDEKRYEALGLFSYEVKKDKRRMEEVYIDSNITKNKIIGFINNNSNLKNCENHLFNNEGVTYKNFYGTYILGPILVRNPEFVKYILDKLTKKNLKYDLQLEERAYREFIKNYTENLES